MVDSAQAILNRVMEGHMPHIMSWNGHDSVDIKIVEKYDDVIAAIGDGILFSKQNVEVAKEGRFITVIYSYEDFYGYRTETNIIVWPTNFQITYKKQIAAARAAIAEYEADKQ